MGLKETFQMVADAVFIAFGNVQKTGLTYVVKDDSYVPGSGISEDDTEYTVNGYLLDYELDEINGVSVLGTDRRFLLKVQDYPLITPKAGDELIDDTNVVWRVKRTRKDPADAVWDIQLRLAA